MVGLHPALGVHFRPFNGHFLLLLPAHHPLPGGFIVSRKSPLKQFAPLIALLVVAGVVIAIVGMARSGDSGQPRAEVVEQIALANRLLADGHPERALRALDEAAGDEGERALGEEGRFLRLRALDAASMNRELATSAASFLEAFPDSTARLDVRVMQLAAETQTAGLSNPQLLQSVEKFVADHPDHAGAGRLQLALARHELSLGDRSAAQRRLSRARVVSDEDRETVAEIQRSLGSMNLEALLRGDPDFVETVTHEVRSGETIWEIARRHGISQELLMRSNNITNPSALRVGQALRVPKVEFSLVCDVSTNTLRLYNHENFVKSYPVRTGRRAGSTPTGEFRILNKKTDPTWRPGDGRVYLPGDPNNELGTRWMAFQGDLYGIHGTVRPETVGHYASNGCIGMKTEDVEELFDLITVGTPLIVKGEQDLSQARVIDAAELPEPLSTEEIARLR